MKKMKLNKLEKELRALYREIEKGEELADQIAAEVDPKYRLSSKNLYRYLILRQYNLRKLHEKLTELGISSLGSSEAYVYKNVANALKLVKLMRGKAWEPNEQIEAIGYQKSIKLLKKHAFHLFNANRKAHYTEIMVTMPDEAAENIGLIRNLIQAGMEIARINLSHGDEEQWEKMVTNLRQASQELKTPIKIYMDLAGPKIRTGEVAVPSAKGNIKDFIRIREGDLLVLTKKDSQGKRAVVGYENEVLDPAEIGVLLPQIIDDVKVGQPVFFDDGMIEAEVVGKKGDEVTVCILKTYKSKLKGHKGINLPETRLNLPSLTERDIELLPFVIAHADIVGYSFVRNAKDVRKLYRELDKLDSQELGVVFKIENREAVDNLPLILFQAMKRRKIGVMIARGDLAVEIGYERISEVQNDILWICEAAHIPVIWATQVLENLAKTGKATRAEISDAAVSAQAECVMLNKGPHIVEAVRVLNSILTKMERQFFKKKNTLRTLPMAKDSLKSLNRKFV